MRAEIQAFDGSGFSRRSSKSIMNCSFQSISIFSLCFWAWFAFGFVGGVRWSYLHPHLRIFLETFDDRLDG